MNPLGELSQEMELHYYRLRRPVPHQLIRSHRHTWADTDDAYPVRVVASGCFAGVPEYVVQLGKRTPPGVGGVIITIDNDKWTLKTIPYAPAPPKIWTLPKATG